MGKIEEINVKGLDVNMIIVYKYNLILIAMLSHEFTKKDSGELRKEVEKSLDMFYSSYLKEITDKESIEVSKFYDFKEILSLQIQDYLDILNDKEKAKEVGDFGFFTEAIKKIKKTNKNN